MKTLIDLFEKTADKFSNNPLLLEKKNDRFEPTSFSQTREQVHRFAAGLMALGIQKGDRLALLSEGRNDWVISELGIVYAGAINVPLSIKLTEPSDLKFRLVHSGTRMMVVSGGQNAKMSSLKEELATLEKIILLDAPESRHPKDILYSEVLSLGDEFLKTNKAGFDQRVNSIGPDDYANICYTSGTTADPKGIILSHRNYTSNVEQGLSLMDVHPWYTTLLILPWDHAFAHTAGIYILMSAGGSIASVQSGKTPMETLKNIPINIKEVKPVFLLSVPALAKNFRKNIEKGISDKGKLAEGLFSLALRTAYLYNGIGWDKGKGWRIILKPLVSLFDSILFKKVREAFGGRLRFFIGGGALLDIELQRFFYAIGIPMFQGYGLSEAAPIISSNSERKAKLGSSGYLVSNIEVKICDDKGLELPTGEKGEIVVRGENVMKGYWKNEMATADTIKDGWLYTGDMGYMDPDGFLYVLGRFKSLLIADDGEKYSPEGIEEAFCDSSKYLDQCMLYNNQNPYTVALVVPNKEALKRYLKEKHLDPSSEEGRETALQLVESEIFEYRTGGKFAGMFPQRWMPPAIGVLNEAFTEDNHMMNSTLKMVRGKITEHYKARIEYLYTPEAKIITNRQNLEAMQKLLG
ncbi:MAG: AMP-binding protein [Bacteroidales bacterium]